MAKSLLANVFSHWHKSYDGFQTSTMEFYAAVEAGIARRIPGIATSRVTFHEGGTVSAKREYLRVVRKKLTFDLCAAPFGTGYFFSWWLGEKKPSRWLCLILLLQIILPIYFVRAMRFPQRDMWPNVHWRHSIHFLLVPVQGFYSVPLESIYLWVIAFIVLAIVFRLLLPRVGGACQRF